MSTTDRAAPRPAPAPTRSGLSPARRALLTLMQRLRFGRIENLSLRGGEPAFGPPPPRLVRDVKFPAEPAPPAAAGADFHLKQQVVELFAVFDRLQDGVIDLIEVKHGLPFRLQHAEALA